MPSRQQKRQKQKVREGKCSQCGRARHYSKKYCDDCLDKIRERRYEKRDVRSPRRPYLPRRNPKTFSPYRLRKGERRALKCVEYPDVMRPRTRAECWNVPRPCPFVSCKYHLYLDINKCGSFTLTFPGKEPWEVNPSCALDVAEEGGHTLEEVGNILGVTRERIRQIEKEGKEKLEADPDMQQLERERAA